MLTQADSIIHLNGKQALAYARVRYVGSDFARTGRQREVIMLFLDKIKKMALPELNDLAEQFFSKFILSSKYCYTILNRGIVRINTI